MSPANPHPPLGSLPVSPAAILPARDNAAESLREAAVKRAAGSRRPKP
jgi:hypothetical protein